MKYPLAVIFLILMIAVLNVMFRNRHEKSVGAQISIGSVKVRVEVVDEREEQIQGLSGRESLCPDCGMLFVFERAERRNFWMKDMRFALDMIFIRKGEVVEIVADISAPSSAVIPQVQSREEADTVLEVNAGFAKSAKIKVGDKVGFDNLGNGG